MARLEKMQTTSWCPHVPGKDRGIKYSIEQTLDIVVKWNEICILKSVIFPLTKLAKFMFTYYSQKYIK